MFSFDISQYYYCYTDSFDYHYSYYCISLSYYIDCSPTTNHKLNKSSTIVTITFSS